VDSAAISMKFDSVDNSEEEYKQIGHDFCWACYLPEPDIGVSSKWQTDGLRPSLAALVKRRKDTGSVVSEDIIYQSS
jgi:hypothetical protein